MGDRERRVKHLTSIMTSPVVFATTEENAARLGLDQGPVTTRDLVEHVAGGNLEFTMTSATQSNSGFSAYIAMLTALAELESTSGSSGWPRICTSTGSNAAPTRMSSEPIGRSTSSRGCRRSASCHRT